MGQQPAVWIVTDVISASGLSAPAFLAFFAAPFVCILSLRLHYFWRRIAIP
ncbi:putative cytoplasmic protein [Escherichia coli H605]|uniref:Cytoplasmic protein n=1 Tax=Escherichia coli H605 TaxID=656410 RepID=A0AAJ3P172_ECOLX|nr:putative cytoplasmic protein [Escherichia coli 1-176-05_S3_C2]OSL50137.1 putative cytoplasmic protein [Escherichia coli H605]